MKIIIGSDHRGVGHKSCIIEYLKSQSIEVFDVGCHPDVKVDYTDVVQAFAKKMYEDLDNNIGIILCGSGIGVSIAINRYKHLRGAVVYNEEVAHTSREHNNANVICLGADFTSYEHTLEYVTIFLKGVFEGGRHQARVDALLKLGD